jgi:hypothetical protein
MKNIVNLILIIFLLVTAATAVKQAVNIRVLGNGPITSPVTSPEDPTPTEDVTPTPTPTVEPTPTAHPSNNNNNSNNGSNNSSSNSNPGPASAPTCGTEKPRNIPKIISIKRSGTKQLTITWTKIEGPASYYLIAFGTKSGVYEYATPEIAGRDTISYTINELAVGRTYFLKLRAGNGCMPGEYSPETYGRVSGRINAPQKIATHVAGISTKSVTTKATSSPSLKPQASETQLTIPKAVPVVTKPQQTVVTKVALFLKDLFRL